MTLPPRTPGAVTSIARSHASAMCLLVAQILLVLVLALGAESFSPPTSTAGSFSGVSRGHKKTQLVVLASKDTDRRDESSPTLSSYGDSDDASKGVVGSLTGLVNGVSSVARDEKEPRTTATTTTTSAVPQSPEELLERIRADYQERNYLWTGDLDLGCFDERCVFTDPTISFVGTDKFTENTQNLVPIVEAFAEDYRSDLLSISLGSKASGNDGGGGGDEYYVETRWNMVGSLTASPWLFWKPKIDVIGRTRFWFRNETGGKGSGYRVYFYDESWEMAAWKALLQIVTPAGTFPSSAQS